MPPPALPRFFERREKYLKRVERRTMNGRLLVPQSLKARERPQTEQKMNARAGLRFLENAQKASTFSLFDSLQKRKKDIGFSSPRS